MSALSVPKIVTTEETAFFETASTVTDGTTQTLISNIVPTSRIRSLHQIVVVCRIEGEFLILEDSELIGSGRTGAATPNVPFSWTPPRPVVAGKSVVVTFKARKNSPSVSIEVHLQASDQTV